jgi:glycosyltransferase involved in cell wall biosynthesis
MRKITYFVGGSVGSNPFAPNTWSGSSSYLLEAMIRAGLLEQAVGLKLSSLRHLWYGLKNFAPRRTVWRRQYHFDLSYRDALTSIAGSVNVDSPVCMQVGSMFCLPAVFPHRKCVSYHDGNLPEVLNSGFGLDGVPAKRIDQALRYERAVAQKMNAIFTFSEYLRQSFITNFGANPDKVFNVGGAINLSTFPDINPEKNYGLQKILFIGIEPERKGCNLLLESFRTIRQRFPKAELHIVGPSNLKELSEGVVFHGFLSKTDPDQKKAFEALLSDCTLFVLPSLYEPFGIAPLEAMIYQIPCVLTNDWAFREFVTPGVNGELIEKGSVEDLTEKICSMLADPSRLALMGQCGRELVLSRYTWDAVVSRMSAVIEAL